MLQYPFKLFLLVGIKMSEINYPISKKRLEQLWMEGVVEPISLEEAEELKQGDTLLFAMPNKPFPRDGRFSIFKLSGAPVRADESVKIKISDGCDILASSIQWPDNYGFLVIKRHKAGEVSLDTGNLCGVYRKVPGINIPVTELRRYGKSGDRIQFLLYF